jgi:DNA-binding NtrC family response regulator
VGSKKDDTDIRKTERLEEDPGDEPNLGFLERRASLVVYHRDAAELVPLRPGEPVSVGRELPARIRVQDPSLSREHAKFTLTDGKVMVEDCGSTNGTRVNGKRVPPGKPREMRPGDEAQMGGVRVFVHTPSPAEGELPGLCSHERFRLTLEDEVARARYFGRPLAVLLVRAERNAASHVGRWAATILKLLRPVDRAALFSQEAVEILLPEMPAEAALSLANAILGKRSASDPPLFVGVALFPDAAKDAESLCQLSLEAAERATPSVPVFQAGLGREPPEAPSSNEPLFVSPTMKDVLEMVRRVARSPLASTVLVDGETGVGKEVVARAIHAASPRRGRPYLAVNCGAIPGQLLESLLFGHVKGAFTGADKDKEGVFEAGEGGTVLLDEIGELPLASQATLLRVLEEKHVMRLGTTKESRVDVRVIAATNRDLEAMVAQGTFRKDLLYRLDPMRITVPPLRDRAAEIEPLAMRFLRRASEVNGCSVRGFTPGALALLKSYTWPGNVRELRNAVDRAVLIASSDLITEEDLPERVRAAVSSAPLEPPPSGVVSKKGAPPKAEPDAAVVVEPLEESEARHLKERILATLKITKGNKTQAAKLLKIPLRTLAHKIKKLGITRPGYEVE